MDRWLLLDDVPAPGAENMARDELLFERAARGGSPILRLYSFEPAAITIGYHQDPDRILDLGAMRADHIDFVRRVTGGRALLHDGELTYCIAAPVGAMHADTRPGDAYLGISEALCAALRSIGVDASVSRGREHDRATGMIPPCLCSVSRHELTARGRKIAGSARRTTAAAFLQHGSILLRPGSARIAKYVRGSWDMIEHGITSVADELEGAIDPEALRSALVKSFSDRFGVEWSPFCLSGNDEDEVRRRALAKRGEASGISVREVCSP
jgi:lipoate-protein ligase A